MKKQVVVYFIVFIADFAPLNAVVFLPPKREQESWDNFQSIATKEISNLDLKEVPNLETADLTTVDVAQGSSSSSRALNVKAVKLSKKSLSKEMRKESSAEKKVESFSPQKTAQSEATFSFDGINRIMFYLRGSKRAEWESSIPSIDWNMNWSKPSAWTGFSFQEFELHHFFVRQNRRGPEPLYRVYTLPKLYDFIDAKICDSESILLLFKKKSDSTNPNSYYLLKAQNNYRGLERKKAWTFSLESNQDLLHLVTPNCQKVLAEGYPKSYNIQLN